MREFLLTTPGGEQKIASIERHAEKVCVCIGEEKFEFSKRELQEWTGQSHLQNGHLFLCGRGIQRALEVEPYVPAKNAMAGQGHEHEHGQAKLQALFPGKVVKVLVDQEGWVDADTLLVIMESMKMEYSYRAPKRIFIEKVLVKEGQVLSKGESFFQTHE